MITVLIILAYLVIGSLIVAVMRWADRNRVNEVPWFDEHADNLEISMVVLLWPLILTLLLFVAIIKLPSLFYKGLMILLTTIVYVIKALAGKGDSDGSTDNSADNY